MSKINTGCVTSIVKTIKEIYGCDQEFIDVPKGYEFVEFREVKDKDVYLNSWDYSVRVAVEDMLVPRIILQTKATRLRATRTIVIEGSREWVEMTLRESYVTPEKNLFMVNAIMKETYRHVEEIR